MAVLRKYDVAFHRSQFLATTWERTDTTSSREPTVVRGRLLGIARVRVNRTPGWHGHCNGWTAASIRHAEPQHSVERNGVVFTPADIKGLLAEIYMYQDTQFLGGVDEAINPGLLHVILANWVGRGKHPIAMESALGREVWNYPIYAYASTFAKRPNDLVEVKVNCAYAQSTNREYDRSPRVQKVKYFHYLLHLDENGCIDGGEYFRDSARLDMLWTPLHPKQGGQEGNEPGNPHVDVHEVLSIWRESVPEEIRKGWRNIDAVPEDRWAEEAAETAGDTEATLNPSGNTFGGAFGDGSVARASSVRPCPPGSVRSGAGTSITAVAMRTSAGLD
jgi:hypothetical protein